MPRLVPGKENEVGFFAKSRLAEHLALCAGEALACEQALQGDLASEA